ncbi:hypothetical protein K461DRAFT_257498, partial [Myriangium duriaei CBS 260.36]
MPVNTQITALPETTIRTLGSTQSLNDSISVVKELIDNALDAGATSISIEVSSNILDIIQVKDNGTGIAPFDRSLVARRHYTSKITNSDDLSQVGGRTLGFRGEALSHIAEMCQDLTVTTRVDGESAGSILHFNRDGSLRSEQPKSHAIGTTVRVEQFLTSYPVRKQIALNNKMEMIKGMRAMCQAYAFARHGMRISFSVLKSTKQSERWLFASRTPDTLKDTAMKVVGHPAAAQCQLVEMQYDTIAMSALLPKPDSDLSVLTSLGQFVSIDGRPLICSRGIGKTLLDEINKNPGWCKVIDRSSKSIFVCLKIACSSPKYDINIDSAKDDVLLENPGTILQILRQSLDLAY